MSYPVDSKTEGGLEKVELEGQMDHSYDLDEKAQIADYKADAIEAENAEHTMTVLEAVRMYPMAAFWAFVMSFTIVRCFTLFLLTLSFSEGPSQRLL
jgi:MFS transporter, SP family, general alpha glucoside:H+ symporter